MQNEIGMDWSHGKKRLCRFNATTCVLESARQAKSWVDVELIGNRLRFFKILSSFIELKARFKAFTSCKGQVCYFYKTCVTYRYFRKIDMPGRLLDVFKTNFIEKSTSHPHSPSLDESHRTASQTNHK